MNWARLTQLNGIRGVGGALTDIEEVGPVYLNLDNACAIVPCESYTEIEFPAAALSSSEDGRWSAVSYYVAESAEEVLSAAAESRALEA